MKQKMAEEIIIKDMNIQLAVDKLWKS
jgi:hypothetical protein